MTALTAVGALVFTALSLQATRDQFGLSEQGQLTDRFSKAVELLGSKESVEARLGGIYALERLARDSARDHPTAMEVLSAFLREHAPLSACPNHGSWQRPGTDVQAILTVLTRRDRTRDRDLPDLRETCLSGAHLAEANLTSINFSRANLRGANLSRANLRGAYLSDADLSRADLSGSDLSNAYLGGANLTDAELRNSNLPTVNAALWATEFSGADLSGANLRGASLTNANFSDARLSFDDDGCPVDLTNTWLDRVKFIRTNLVGANLEGAHLTSTDFTGADLTGTRMPRRGSIMSAPPGDGLSC